MTAHVLRFSPEYVSLREAVVDGQLGNLRFATFERWGAAPNRGEWWRNPDKSGGGAFDLLIHDVDFCLHAFGKPKSVSASGYCEPERGLDFLNIQLFYEHGGVAAISGGWMEPAGYPSSAGYRAVSYTHLDVYKRQVQLRGQNGSEVFLKVAQVDCEGHAEAVRGRRGNIAPRRDFDRLALEIERGLDRWNLQRRRAEDLCGAHHTLCEADHRERHVCQKAHRNKLAHRSELDAVGRAGVSPCGGAHRLIPINRQGLDGGLGNLFELQFTDVPVFQPAFADASPDDGEGAEDHQKIRRRPEAGNDEACLLYTSRCV